MLLRVCVAVALVLLTGAAACAPEEAALAETSACGGVLNPQELALARLFERDLDQRRARMRCDPILSRVARARALDMGTRRYFDHVPPSGDAANRQVERAGYALPRWYPRDRTANNIEVIAAGDETPDRAWRTWLQSRPHRAQVLGLSPRVAEQTDYGVGYAQVSASPYRYYWVLITARH